MLAIAVALAYTHSSWIVWTGLMIVMLIHPGCGGGSSSSTTGGGGTGDGIGVALVGGREAVWPGAAGGAGRAAGGPQASRSARQSSADSACVAG